MTTRACEAQGQQRGKGRQAEAAGQRLVFGWWSKPEAPWEDVAQPGASLGSRIRPQGLAQRLTERAAQF